MASGEFDPSFVAVASWLTGTYRAAGRDDRAQAVRPSRRRKGLRLADASRATPAAATADAEAPATTDSEAPTPAAGNERPALRFAPLRHALRRLGGRSCDDEPPRAVEAGT